MASELYTMNQVKSKKGKKKKSKAKKSAAKNKVVTKQVIKYVPAPKKKYKKKSNSTVTKKYKKKSKKRKLSKMKFSIKNYIETLKIGAWNGAGAFATDIAFGFARPMLPDIVAYGKGRHLARIGLGLILGNLVATANKKFADAIVTGTTTVAGYEFVKEFVQPMLPAGMVLGEYVSNDMGRYVTGNVDQLGNQLGYTGSGQDAGLSGMTESSYYNAYA